MSVFYKVKEYVNNTSEKNGYFFARAQMMGETRLKDIAERIQRNCSVKKSDVVAVLSEFTEVLRDELQASKRVVIEGLGSFKLGLKTQLVQKATDFKPEHIKGIRVLFQPEYVMSQATGKRSVALTEGARVKRYDEYQLGVNDNVVD